MNSLLLRLAGDAAVTALSSMINSSFVVGALGWGIGGAVLIMGGMMVGEQDINGLKLVMKTALTDILIGVTVLTVAVFAAAPLIARLFVPNAGEAQSMSVAFIRCYALCLPFQAFKETLIHPPSASTGKFPSGSALQKFEIHKVFLHFCALI